MLFKLCDIAIEHFFFKNAEWVGAGKAFLVS